VEAIARKLIKSLDQDQIRQLVGILQKDIGLAKPGSTTRAILNRRIDDSWRQEVPIEQRKPIKAGDYEKRKAEMLKVQGDSLGDKPGHELDRPEPFPQAQDLGPTIGDNRGEAATSHEPDNALAHGEEALIQAKWSKCKVTIVDSL
jgi:hypothetical protein